MVQYELFDGCQLPPPSLIVLGSPLLTPIHSGTECMPLNIFTSMCTIYLHLCYGTVTSRKVEQAYAVSPVIFHPFTFPLSEPCPGTNVLKSCNNINTLYYEGLFRCFRSVYAPAPPQGFGQFYGSSSVWSLHFRNVSVCRLCCCQSLMLNYASYKSKDALIFLTSTLGQR
jgi:hypothetical protein